MQTNTAEKLTANWVKQNGMQIERFDKLDLLYVRAQQTAYNVLKHHISLLNAEQATILNDYLTIINNKRRQNQLTHKKAYAVLNIGTKINRQVFKAYKSR